MINSISMYSPAMVNETATTKAVTTSAEAQQNFANTLKTAIESVNGQQIQSDSATQKLINGEDIELHEVMIAAQKASVSLNTTIEIRNKVVEAYQEIMRMSV